MQRSSKTIEIPASPQGKERLEKKNDIERQGCSRGPL